MCAKTSVSGIFRLYAAHQANDKIATNQQKCGKRALYLSTSATNAKPYQPSSWLESGQAARLAVWFMQRRQ